MVMTSHFNHKRRSPWTGSFLVSFVDGDVFTDTKVLPGPRKAIEKQFAQWKRGPGRSLLITAIPNQGKRNDQLLTNIKR